MQRLNCDINQFVALLENTDFNKLEISQYSKNYIKKNHKSVKYSAQLAFQILNSGIEKINKPIEEITIAEIGGGTGLISLLAVFSGFGKVVYSDIYSQSCEDFKIISNHLNLPVSKTICGSIYEIKNETSGDVDLIVSRDVIEHIYDTKDFFGKSSELFKNTVHIHNTSANIYNIFKMKYFKKIHLADEYKGGHNPIKPSDSTKAFFDLRFNFIKENFKELDEKTSIKLAELTRGKTFADIKSDIENFQLKKTLPHENTHKTNTCDPVTGNRTENLLKFEEYEKLIDKSVFDIEWDFAFYDFNEKNLLKLFVKKILNFIIKISGERAKYLTPAIILICRPKK